VRFIAASCVVACAVLRLTAQANGQQDFETLSKRAAAALQSDPAEAAKLYRQAVETQPAWAEGWFYLAASLYEIRQYGESQKAFERAAILAPDNGTVWAFLGLCEYDMGGYQKALADIRKGEGLGLGNDRQFISSIRNHAALIYLRRAEFGAAMEQLEPLARLGDDSPATIENIGVSALGLKYAPSDIPSAKKPLIELAGRAWWTLSAQHTEEARALLEDLVKQYPNEAGVHYLYGLYLEKTQPDSALQEFQKEIEIRPSHVPARLQAAMVEMKIGAAETAVKLALDAVGLEPANPYCYVGLGRAYLSAAQPAKAAQVLEKAVKLAPQDRQPHLYLAQAYQKLGRVAEAEKEQAAFSRLKASQDPVSLLNGSGMHP